VGTEIPIIIIHIVKRKRKRGLTPPPRELIELELEVEGSYM
jgi:hypothetical protein